MAGHAPSPPPAGPEPPGTHAERAEARRFRILGAIAAVAIVLAGTLYAGLTWRKVVRATPALVERAERLAQRGVAFDDLPPAWRGMLIAVQDPGFFEHRGVDLTTPGGGFTTITGALAQWHYARPFKGGMTRIERMIAALALDRHMGKELQLALYLNTARFGQHDGRPLNGFRQAAIAWFGRPLRALTDAQFAALVAALLSPDEYSPLTRPRANAERVRRIERYLAGDCAPSGVTDVTYETCAT